MQLRPAERQPSLAARSAAVRAAPVVVAAPPTASQALQRKLGNAGLSAMLAGQEQRVGRVAANPSGGPMVARSPAQALVVSSPSDAAEREAEKAGQRVMAMSPGPPAAAHVSKPEAAKIARAAAPASRPAPGTLDPDIAREVEAAQSGGSPLPEAIRNHMERSFQADFSRVRIHTDEQAGRLSVRLGARAFTRGNHIYFARGAFSPDTRSGGELIAHELTHTIQQGHAVQRRAEMPSSAQGEHASLAIQRAPAPASASAATTSEVVDISSGVFCPSERVKDEIEAQRDKGLDVRVVVKGLTAEGRVKVRTDSRKNYVSFGKGSMPLLNPWTEQLGGMHLNFGVIKNEIVHGYASLKPRGGDTTDWLQALQKNSSVLGGLGLKVGHLPKSVNKFDAGKLTLGVSNLEVEVGGFVDALFNLSVENMGQPKIDATANIGIKGLAKGQLKLNNDAGKLVGQVSLAIDYKAFSGEAKVIYKADGRVDVGGKAAYSADKLSGEIQFVATDLEAANSFTKNAIAAAGGRENVQQAAAPSPVPAPKEGQKKRALAATGQLAFNLTNWFAGAVNVIVDGNGAITVIGKIAPPAEICLFTPKDWDHEIIKFEAKAYYGIPVVGDLNLFANISLHALATLGPAKIYNIEILGTYSTDPDVQKNIQISGSINISAYGGLKLRAEGGAGVEILDHDIKFGIGLAADVGVKAYADARPTIGYRDPGVFYISGTLELAAQPVLGLGGDFFIALETPWWSPLSDDRWTWPLFSKEWPLADPIGISAAVKDYELGSHKVPEIELKKPEFDPSKFMTSMVDKTLPEKSGGAGAAHGTFKEDGTVPKPVVPPKKPAPKAAAAKPPKKGAPLKGGKSASPDPKAAKEKQSGKILQSAAKPLAALKAKEALIRSELDKELTKIKRQVSGIEFSVQVKSGKWLVTPKAGGKTAKGIEIAAKLSGQDQDEKIDGKPDGKDVKDERTGERKKHDLAVGLAQLHSKGAQFIKQKHITKEDAVQIASAVKAANPVFQSLTVVAGNETWDYAYVASPSRTEKGDIPREIETITLADLDGEDSVKPGSWDCSFSALVRGEKVVWGFASVPLGPDPDLPPPPPSWEKPGHSMVIDNRVTRLGEPIKLKLAQGKFTDFALAKSIKLYEKRYGELKQLYGDLRESNLANFQAEYAQRRKKEMDREPAAQEAIREISFGRARIPLGFNDFDLRMSGYKIMDIPGIGPSYVPTSVKVMVKKT
jgi:hypothetical protein